jgi:peptide/nickel transport system permease protein
MGRFLLRRLLSAAATLLVLSVVVFAFLNVLPGNPGRAIMGNLADEAAVQALNEQLGYNDSLPTRYFRWVGGVLQGDFGQSYAFQRDNGPLIWDALFESSKLALMAFSIVVPLSLAGGVVAGLRKGRATDRTISTVGLSGIAIPEFVSGLLLVFLFAITWEWFPGQARADEGANVLEQAYHLVLPSLTLVIVLFGYIARMARAGTIDALESDYTRTATLKGLPRSTVLRRHVLRNGLVPTVAVVSTQVGYLIAGLAVVETTFVYPGLGSLIIQAIPKKDFPLLQSAILVVGIIYMVSTLLGDLVTAALNPRVRLGGDG